MYDVNLFLFVIWGFRLFEISNKSSQFLAIKLGEPDWTNFLLALWSHAAYFISKFEDRNKDKTKIFVLYHNGVVVQMFIGTTYHYPNLFLELT